MQWTRQAVHDNTKARSRKAPSVTESVVGGAHEISPLDCGCDCCHHHWLPVQVAWEAVEGNHDAGRGGLVLGVLCGGLTADGHSAAFATLQHGTHQNGRLEAGAPGQASLHSNPPPMARGVL